MHEGHKYLLGSDVTRMWEDSVTRTGKCSVPEIDARKSSGTARTLESLVEIPPGAHGFALYCVLFVYFTDNFLTTSSVT